MSKIDKLEEIIYNNSLYNVFNQNSLRNDYTPYCSITKLISKYEVKDVKVSSKKLESFQTCLNKLNSIVYDWLNLYAMKLSENSSINKRKLAKTIRESKTYCVKERWILR